MLISLDCEATGLDLAHGAMPFLVTSTDDSGTIRYWEWDVDPLTRRPEIPSGDLVDIAELLGAAELIYLQNSKYDARALAAIGIAMPWEKVRDTLCMGHLLASNHPHDLTWMCVQYLGADIEPLEVAVKGATRICRAHVKRDDRRALWKIAREGAMDMPSVKDSSKRDEDKPWKNDMWLLRALARQYRAEGDEHLIDWVEDACARYANGDSEHTLPLGLEMERLIRERGLWAIYEHRCRLPQAYCEMEQYGVTAIGEHTERTMGEYEQYVAEAGGELVGIAAEYGHVLELADGAAINDNMRDFFYGGVRQNCVHCRYERRVKHWNGESVNGEVCPKCATRKRSPAQHQLQVASHPNLSLKVLESGKTGNATLNADAMQTYLTTLDDGPARDFIQILTDKRKHDTSLTYMRAYSRFWVPVPNTPGYYRIHASINPFGTDHLRAASNSPNLQNVGKQEQRCEECDGKGCTMCGGTGLAMLSARCCFGPAPGREWWGMDFESIEKRIPTYECMEPALIELFERPNDPPYWGSDHNLLASLLWPDLYNPIAHIRGEFKRRYVNEYKRGKNTNFAKQYGAGRRKVDATAKVPGAYDLIDRGTPRLAALQRHYLDLAERTGYVETLPDRGVDSRRGYPIIAGRTDDGRVLSTTPFNYHVSGTACWAKNRALVRCADQLEVWRQENGFDGHVALEIHDEILFDFPRGDGPGTNKVRAMVLRRLMEQSGADLIPPIPTPVSVEYHAESWAKGVAVG